MTTAQTIYRTIQDAYPHAAYLANCILTGSTKPTTKLRNLLRLLESGRDIQDGNRWGTLRIDGEQVSFSALD